MLSWSLVRRFYGHTAIRCTISSFSTFSRALYKASNHLPPRPTLPDAEIKETYVKGTGPGGQKINKTNSAAQLTHIPTGIVVKCQATRSKSQNYTIARRLLAEKVEVLQKGEESLAVKVVERKSKKKRSADKKKRRKYRQLAGEVETESKGADDGEECNGYGEADDAEEAGPEDLRDDKSNESDGLQDEKLNGPESNSGSCNAPKRSEFST
ncbi:hypothetical protein A1O7_03271 [Cladophialophora yegresii CBS 114405]|uniref:Prokaryotic-type class I peptide chain release factors domain-containing protein n=1 Tax=Cladophialophora yegresii CBS 114405 TaxID=1182544 RepID=W9WE57_9EURO|nr:uncharacterized protein A1O7_03271 [Cladophialophora yegresii CBS 114405]EXJ62831.1 hypothetical protein A1O7_03271 [Cladophialophora yegresii CBS 114405]